MLIGKALLYLSTEANDVCQQAADVCMAVFVVLFVVTRNIVFNWLVLTQVCWAFANTSWTIVLLKGLLLTLVGLMTFWLWLIVKVIYNQFFCNQGHVDDTRETK